MRSWPLLARAAIDKPVAAPAAEPEPELDNVCARPGCESETAGDAFFYCSEKCQAEHAFATRQERST